MTDRFEIPESMRDFAEKSVDHARKAFDDYIASAQKAVGTLESSAADAQGTARSFGEKTIAFAEENMASSFEYARNMVNAQSVDDMMRIQNDFIERQMAILARQSQDLSEAASASPRSRGRDTRGGT
ncbi:phasin family protein [Microbaculum marinum]|uniref:Phasin family protein n=1 Tax=Microbaculum marinum TaxID=1764581 RepID=A0AAW9RS22_9HYPH